MDDLLRSLRGLGVSAPSPDQLMELLDADISTQRRLAQSLSFELLDPDDPLATGDLLEGAIQAVLENYRRSVDKERSILKVSSHIREDLGKRCFTMVYRAIKSGLGGSEGYHTCCLRKASRLHRLTTRILCLLAA